MEYAGISMTRKTIIRALTLLLVGVFATVVLIYRFSFTDSQTSYHWAMGVSDQVSGCTIVGGERYGFATDLADSLAVRCGRTLEVQLHLKEENILEALEVGSINLAIIPAHECEQFKGYPTETLYTTNYTLLLPSWSSGTRGTSPEEAWRGKRIISNRSFHHTSSFASLVEIGARCDSTHWGGVAMAQRLIGGKADAIICVPEEAALLTFLYRNIREAGSIEEPAEVMVVFANRALHKEFMGEMEEFVKSEGYASMVGVYFGGNSPSEHFAQLKYRPTRVVDGISIWDKQLKSIAEKIGVDWRLMSAMAYHESRFRNDQISHKGAVGLMQVTPIVAQEFKLDDGYDLSDPSTNITLAAKLIRRSSRALGFGDFPNSDDGLAIVVASYNCGITRTLEAQRLCKEYGYNKYSWRDMAEMFRNMSSAEWISSHDYRMGRFGDAEVTIAYTEGVMELYGTYRSSLPE